MKTLLGGDLLLIGAEETPHILETLKSWGYKWQKMDWGDTDTKKVLYTPDGSKCVGEKWRGGLYLDGCLKELVEQIIYDKANMITVITRCEACGCPHDVANGNPKYCNDCLETMYWEDE